MKYFAIIVLCFLGVLGGTFGDHLKDAIQMGNERISALKEKWFSEIPEIEATIIPEIDNIRDEFTATADRVIKEVSNDDVKKQKAINIKVAYNWLLDEAKKFVNEMANARPEILGKFFSGKEIASFGYDQVNEVLNNLEIVSKGNSCKESIFAKFVEIAEDKVTEITDCVVDGGSNFPMLPNDIRSISKSLKKFDRNFVLFYQRCPQEMNPMCFDNCGVLTYRGLQLIQKIRDAFVNGEHEEISVQKIVSQQCVKRRANTLKKDAERFQLQMAQCN